MGVMYEDEEEFLNAYRSLPNAYQCDAERYVKTLTIANQLEQQTLERIRELRAAEAFCDAREVEPLVGFERRCCFCGSKEEDGRLLYLGIGKDNAIICDKCVRICMAMLDGNGAEIQERREKSKNGSKKKKKPTKPDSWILPSSGKEELVIRRWDV